MAAVPAVRMQHYQFAATALPTMLFREPRGIVDLLSGPDRDRFLADFWRRTGEQFGANSAAPLPPPTAAACDAGPQWRAIVITLPPPTAPAEAYFVAVWVSLATPPLAPRYFALERGEPERDSAEHFLCEWTQSGAHVNHRPAETATLAGFVAAVGAVLTPRGAGGR